MLPKRGITARASPPSRGRGLEPSVSARCASCRCRPPRGGVDWNSVCELLWDTTPEVAPLAGAWIGTRARRGCRHRIGVAPLAGAWIGTASSNVSAQSVVSPPSRGRGLEQAHERRRGGADFVAPLAGAWIGTSGGGAAGAIAGSPPSRGRGLEQPAVIQVALDGCRPPRGGVDWNSRR